MKRMGFRKHKCRAVLTRQQKLAPSARAGNASLGLLENPLDGKRNMAGES